MINSKVMLSLCCQFIPKKFTYFPLERKTVCERLGFARECIPEKLDLEEGVDKVRGVRGSLRNILFVE